MIPLRPIEKTTLQRVSESKPVRLAKGWIWSALEVIKDMSLYVYETVKMVKPVTLEPAVVFDRDSDDEKVEPDAVVVPEEKEAEDFWNGNF